MTYPPTIPDDARPVQSAWPDLTCFGCGPANPDGMHLESYVASDESLVAGIQPDPCFQVSPDVVYGGTIASLIDCHGVWTALTFRSPSEARPPDHPPSTPAVTAALSVQYEAPTPLDEPLYLLGRVVDADGRRTTVEVELGPETGVTATATLEAVQVDSIGTATRVDVRVPHIPE